MSSIDDKLNEVLNITPEVIEASEISTVEEKLQFLKIKMQKSILIQAVRIYIRC